MFQGYVGKFLEQNKQLLGLPGKKPLRPRSQLRIFKDDVFFPPTGPGPFRTAAERNPKANHGNKWLFQLDDEPKSLYRKWLEITISIHGNKWLALGFNRQWKNPPTWTNIFTWPSFSNCVSRISRFKSNFSFRRRNERNGNRGLKPFENHKVFEDLQPDEMPVVKMGTHPKLTNVPAKKRDYFNRKLHLNQPLIFRGHVSFPGSRGNMILLQGFSFTCSSCYLVSGREM